LPNSKNIRTTPEAQAYQSWTPPGGTLGELVAAARARAELLATAAGDLERSALSAGSVPSLAAALRRGPEVALIAEIKRASPSRGSIRPELDAASRAAAYSRGGAAAISVLTEPDRFTGSDEDLREAANASGLPTLKKDFHVAPVQLLQARALGASAALLIARALDQPALQDLIQAAKHVGLETVVEVRDLEELERALSAGARIIGVNNRNLETLRMESGVVEAVIPRIPPDRVAIAESGYSDRASVEGAAACGADAILIGSYLSAAHDPEAAVRRLTGVRKVSRAR
jgi:indole-3-glycerol phosphate synthase